VNSHGSVDRKPIFIICIFFDVGRKINTGRKSMAFSSQNNFMAFLSLKYQQMTGMPLFVFGNDKTATDQF